MEKRLYIIGCGGHARSIADVAFSSGWVNIRFVDDNRLPGEKILGYPVISNAEQEEEEISTKFFIIGVGDNIKRKELYSIYSKKPKYQSANIISSNAYISPFAILKSGIFVGHQAYIGPEANIDDDVIINTRATIEHGCIINPHAHIAIGTLLAGKVVIGELSLIGAGCTVIPEKHIEKNIVVGAGAVVTKNFLETGTYVGIPARKISH